MQWLYDLVLVTHLLGMAAVVGGWFTTIGRATVVAGPVMVWGARAQLISGLSLVGLASAVSSLDVHLDHNKVGLKLLIAIVVCACAEMARGRGGRGEDVRVLTNVAGYLAILNVVVAAVW